MTIDLKMLGVVLLSEYNELVHAFGNQQFRQLFFIGPSYSEGNGQLSSSSGVSSHSPMGQVETPRIRTSTMEMHENDGEIEELATIDSKKNPNVDAYPVVGDDQSIIDETQLLSQLMPLIALCRTRGSQMDGANQIECIHSGIALHVQIGNLPFLNLLVLIHSKSIFNGDTFSSDRLFKTLIRCIDFHYGLQLQLISLSPKLLQNIQTRCEQRMLNILVKVDESNKSGDHPQGQNNVDYFLSEADEPFNQNISFGGTQSFIQTELMPHFLELTKIIAQQIGKRCRCLLMHSGHLIGSICSHPPSESIFTSIVPSQRAELI